MNLPLYLWDNLKKNSPITPNQSLSSHLQLSCWLFIHSPCSSICPCVDLNGTSCFTYQGPANPRYSRWLELCSNQLKAHVSKNTDSTVSCSVLRGLTGQWGSCRSNTHTVFETRSNQAKWVSSKNCERAFTQTFQKIGACGLNQHPHHIVIMGFTFAFHVLEL